ncbi:MAG: glycosyltransferase [Candidatus Sulfotelmatobacter sp.]
MTVAYLANRFPAAVEPYVGEEIKELQRRGVGVIPGSVRRADVTQSASTNTALGPEVLCLQPVRVLILLRALGLAVRRWGRIADLVARVLLRGKESPKRRLKALLHTWLGAYYAVLLRDRGVDHVHVHHGYFGSWIGLVAARLLGVDFSMTLHGSDLLLDGAYLDVKLKDCRFCMTISEYNRRHILKNFPAVDPHKIIVSRLGVDVPELGESRRVARGTRRIFTLLAVGRLHAVKDHAFLVRACARLRAGGLDFECWIAGEGPERKNRGHGAGARLAAEKMGALCIGGAATGRAGGGEAAQPYHGGLASVAEALSSGLWNRNFLRGRMGACCGSGECLTRFLIGGWSRGDTFCFWEGFRRRRDAICWWRRMRCWTLM